MRVLTDLVFTRRFCNHLTDFLFSFFHEDTQLNIDKETRETEDFLSWYKKEEEEVAKMVRKITQRKIQFDFRQIHDCIFVRTKKSFSSRKVNSIHDDINKDLKVFWRGAKESDSDFHHTYEGEREKVYFIENFLHTNSTERRKQREIEGWDWEIKVKGDHFMSSTITREKRKMERKILLRIYISLHYSFYQDFD